MFIHRIAYGEYKNITIANATGFSDIVNNYVSLTVSKEANQLYWKCGKLNLDFAIFCWGSFEMSMLSVCLSGNSHFYTPTVNKLQ